jgi:hypothetical protein
MARAISNSGEGAALRGQSPSPLLRSTSTSLQAAAAVNAGLIQEDSRRKLIENLTPASANPSIGSSSISATRNRQSSHAGRRRSAVLMNLQLNDPGVPPAGEMINEGQVSSYRTASPFSLSSSPIISTGDPHHNRAPSLGDIHQELEQEQEAQVVCETTPTRWAI